MREKSTKSIPQNVLICFLLCYNSPSLLPGCKARVDPRVIFGGGKGRERRKNKKARMMGRRECLDGNREGMDRCYCIQDISKLIFFSKRLVIHLCVRSRP